MGKQTIYIADETVYAKFKRLAAERTSSVSREISKLIADAVAESEQGDPANLLREDNRNGKTRRRK